MQTIVPTLWFNDNAEEAVAFYKNVFGDVVTTRTMHYDENMAKAAGRPVGSTMTVDFTLFGYRLVGLNGGPIFSINPSISFSIHCTDAAEVDALWEKLIVGGSALMEVGEYPFSKRYGWLKDKFGVTWQLNAAPRAQKVTPSLMFIGKNAGKAEEAMTFYTSLFPNSKIVELYRYEEGSSPMKEDTGTVNHAVFTLDGQEFIAMDSAMDHKFAFSEGVSLMVLCDTQKDIDTLWEKLTANGGEEAPCGWLKDKYGLSWQIDPKAMDEFWGTEDPKKLGAMFQAMLTMKKLDLATLQKAYHEA